MKTTLALVLTLAVITSNPALAAEAIGKIVNLEGSLHKSTKTSHKNLNVGDEIFLNDKLKTPKGSFAKIEFIDQTSFDLGENTVITIDDFVYDPENSSDNAAKFSVTKGAFHYISGLIAKIEQPDVTINVDYGSIGIRGTQVWRDLTKDEEGNEMCRIYVEDGEVDVSNAQGEVTVGHEGGTKIKGMKAAPTEPKKWKEAAIENIKSKTKFGEEKAPESP